MAVLMKDEDDAVAAPDIGNALLLESDTDGTAGLLLESDTDGTAFLLLEG